MARISELPTLGGVTNDDFLIVNDGDTETKRCSVGAFASSIDLDSRYSVSGHNHDAAYAALVHNHDAAYAALTHNHDTDYAALAGATFTGPVIGTTLNLTLAEYADDAAAGVGGLVEGDLYRTATGEVRIKLA